MIYFHWNVTAMDKNQMLVDVSIASVVTRTNQSTLIEMDKFKINGIYLCYGPSNKQFIRQGSWQWNKPSKSKAHHLLLIGYMLLIPAILLHAFGRCCYQKSMNAHQHQSPSIVTNRNEQFSTTIFEVPPPTYDEAMRGLIGRNLFGIVGYIYPFQHYTDEQLRKALEAVQLKTKIENLDIQIAEYRSNFSVGECQLICVARAILKPSKILLIDEATAHVDGKTDEIIQEILREKFHNQTILTIAHRLNTIMDSDEILVMNKGLIQDYGSPKDILTKQDDLLNKQSSLLEML
ncbi:hypothetical protein I4U23_023081 [Adineta vaga]|nr:hypothetical protein I4U23_023081 [Adineta vaga]